MVWLYHQEEVSILPSEAEEAETTLYQTNGYIDTEIDTANFMQYVYLLIYIAVDFLKMASLPSIAKRC